MCNAKQAAGYMVEKCIRDGQLISNIQLQKILYYAQKVFLQAGSRLFDDDFEAWPFGPVIPSVYYKYSAYGTMPIDFSDGTYQLNCEDTIIIDPIIDSKRVLKPWDLVRETHAKGGAWDFVYKDGLGDHQIIPKQLIQTRG